MYDLTSTMILPLHIKILSKPEYNDVIRIYTGNDVSSVYTDVPSKYNAVTIAYKRYINSYETDLKAAMAFYTTLSSTYLSVLKH